MASDDSCTISIPCSLGTHKMVKIHDTSLVYMPNQSHRCSSWNTVKMLIKIEKPFENTGGPIANSIQ